jgi:crotonobetaine/carnitine-CoA ligase
MSRVTCLDSVAPTLEEPATRTYDELEPTEPEWTRWTGAHVLRRRARAQGDRTLLIAPEEGVELPFAEVLETTERVAGGLRAAGDGRGDRVVIMGRNSSRFVLTWFATALGDLVEAPINTAYEGEFLRHQVELVQARWAVVDSDLVDRFVAIRDRIPLVEGFWVIDQGGQVEAVARLRAAGWGGRAL